VLLTVSTVTAEYGERVVMFGQVQPGVAGEEVALELESAGTWTEVARATTGADGTFSMEIVAHGNGALRAHALGSGTLSTPAVLLVVPKVTVRTRRGLAFVGAKVFARIEPSAYAGRVTLTVERAGRTVGTVTAGAALGRVEARVPTPGIGRFTVTLAFSSAEDLIGRSITTTVEARARTLRSGSSGPDVRALTRRLAGLRFHVPPASAAFGPELTDAVIAFQKAYRLERTGVVGPTTWRRLERARVLKPRYRKPSPHIEIDKTRQILLVVRGGEVQAVLPASTGATGNTPEGRHQIRWKALATTTWLGPAILYRTMTFYGNSFAIHGYYSVPAYPASHGCVRIPIWAADWLYNQSPVGETVYVYR
jgi:hypothetical protein